MDTYPGKMEKKRLIFSSVSPISSHFARMSVVHLKRRSTNLQLISNERRTTAISHWRVLHNAFSYEKSALANAIEVNTASYKPPKL